MGDIGLPVPLGPFVGRRTDLEDVRSLAAAERLVTLTGPGGCGKTRLAIEVAQHTDGPVCFVDLSPFGPTHPVADAIRSTLGLPEHPGQEPATTIAAAFNSSTNAPVLVVDNCEHLVVDAAETLASLLASCPALRVLATSREPLGVPGECVWRVPPLGVPPAHAHDDPDALLAFDAVQLLVDRAGRAERNFTLDATNASLVVALVRGLDGMPLAIELAAAQIGRVGLGRTVAGLDDQLALLRSGARTTSPRQQALEASIRWSYDLLDDRERAVMDQLSVFRGGFTLDAATAVLAPAIEPADVVQLVGQLVDKSLVQRDATDRCTLLESLHQFGQHRLASSGALDVALDRHLRWVAALAHEAEPGLTGRSQAGWLDRIELEVDNVRAALQWAATSDRFDVVLEIACDLTFFWKLHGHLNEGRRWVDEVLAVPGWSPGALARAQWSRSDLAYWAGELPTAITAAELARQEARRAGDARTGARAVWALANAEHVSAGPAQAQSRFRAALALARETDDPWLEGVCLDGLAIATLHLGQADDAHALLAEAEAVFEATENPQLASWNIAVGEILALHACDHARVDELYEQGTRVARTIIDPGSTSFLRLSYCESLLQRGRTQEAVAVLSTELAESEATGHHNLSPAFWFFLYLASRGVDPDRADHALRQLRAAGPLGPFWRSMVLHAGVIEQAAAPAPGDHDVVAEALEVARDLRMPWTTTSLLTTAGLMKLLEDLDDAEQLFHESLALAVEHRYPLRMTEAVFALATTFALREQDAWSVRLLGAADAACEDHGILPPIWDRDVGALVRTRVRERLGDDAYDRAVAEGSSMGLDGAVAAVRRLRGARGRPPEGWASLTPAEARVVALAAEGLTNPQIADRLFVSRGTVKTHLAHAFTKLHVANRTELAALAAQRAASQLS